MRHDFWNWWLRHRRIWLVVLVVAAAALMTGIPSAANPDNAITIWFLDDDPSLVDYYAFHDSFGNDEVLLVEVHEAEGLFRPAALARLKRLVAALENVPDVARVSSFLSSQEAHQADLGLSFARLVPEELPTSPEQLRAMEQRVLAAPSFRGRFVNDDGSRAMLWAEMVTDPGFDSRRTAAVARIRKTVAEHLAGCADGEASDEALAKAPCSYALAGTGVVYAALNEITRRDFGLFLGVCYTVMLVVLWWIFRRKRLVLATVGVMMISSLGTLGLLGLAGLRINMVTSSLPALILVLGLADAVHFPSAFVQEAQRKGDGRSDERSRLSLLKRALQRIWGPCLVTSVTTMAGFLALVTSPMAVLSQMGVFAAIGIALAFVVSLVLMTVALASLEDAPSVPEHRVLRRLLARLEGLVAAWPRTNAVLLLAATAVAVFYGRQVVADSDMMGYLPASDPARVDHNRIEQGWGAYSPIDYTVIPKDGLDARSPELIAGLDHFVREVKKSTRLRDGYSVATLYRSAATAIAPDFGPDDPLTPELVAQLDLLLSQPVEWDPDSPAYSDNYYAPFRTRDADRARVTFISEVLTANEVVDRLARIKEIGDETLAGLATLRPSGYTPLYVRVVDYIITSQVHSFFAALGLIFLVMLAWLRSLRLALISLVPNVFPVLAMFAAMGALGIYLDVATSMVAAVVLGVSIDDTVHFLHHWRTAERSGARWREALKHTYGQAGVPAVITTALLMAGYPVLMLSETSPVRNFGLLTTIAAGAALIGDLVVLPLVLRLWPPSQVENVDLAPTPLADRDSAPAAHQAPV